jgi:hypothetical protein
MEKIFKEKFFPADDDVQMPIIKRAIRAIQKPFSSICHSGLEPESIVSGL